jgi:hypothetical protein
MAKRAAPDEKPYRPLLDAELVSAALSMATPAPVQPPRASTISTPSAKIVEMPKAEPLRRIDQHPIAGRLEPTERSSSAADDWPIQSAHTVVEKFDHEKRILFTRPEAQAIDRLVNALAVRLNSQVKVSHVIRALAALMLNAETEIDRRAGEAGPLVRPANGDAQGLQRFERELGRIIAAAIRDAAPLK